jgi:carbamoyltransferase
MNVIGVYGAFGWDGNKSSFTEENIWVHDAGVSLFVDGVHAASIQLERLTRIKGDGMYPLEAINYCLDAAGITGEDIDLVCVPSQCTDISYRFWHQGKTQALLKKSFPTAKMQMVSHHLAHAASAIFSSPFRNGCFLTLDGTGGKILSNAGTSALDFESNSLGYFDLDKKYIRIFCGPGQLNNFGAMYYGFSEAVYRKKTDKPLEFDGADPKWRDTFAGKMMGLSAYGKHFDIDYDKDRFYMTSKELYYDHTSYIDWGAFRGFRTDDADEQAFIVQKNFEWAMMEYIEQFHAKGYLEDNIVLAGGSFMNIIGNTLIEQSGLFKGISVAPHATDCGLPFGAAAYGVFMNDMEVVMPTNQALLGKVYSDDEITSAIKASGLKCKKFDKFTDLCEFTAKKLNDNNIVGWFQDGSEFGPRALGSRSILMHPGPAENKDIINAKVKHREEWRPFAGIITDDAFSDYFEEDLPSPYMMYNLTVRKDKRETIAAITHIDNSCRVQTVNAELNQKMTTLLGKFEEISGIPVVLNTSFNDNGEPIVESPTDALTSFANMEIDCLIIGDYAVLK